MTPWQRRLRLLFALGAVALAIAVALAFQRRVVSRPGTVGSSDPKALQVRASRSSATMTATAGRCRRSNGHDVGNC